MKSRAATLEKSESKSKFLLFAPEREGSEELKKEIEAGSIGKVERCGSMALARTQVVSGEVQCLILNLKTFGSSEVKLVEMFYSLNKNIVVVVVSKHIDEIAYNHVKDLKYIVLLQRPFREAKIIALFCKKLTTGRETFRREHFRYLANQVGSIEVLSNSKVHLGTIINISRGGALFEADHDMNLIDHELVRLSIQLAEVSKIHLINTEVVWITPYDPKTKKMSIGLKFIDSKEISSSIYDDLKK